MQLGLWPEDFENMSVKSVVAFYRVRAAHWDFAVVAKLTVSLGIDDVYRF